MKKLLPIFLFGTTLGIVIFYLPPPASLTTASFSQLFSLFAPSILFLVFLFNLYFKSFIKSSLISLGLVLLLALSSLQILNLISLPIIILIFLLILKFSRKKVRPTPQKAPPPKILRKIEKAKPLKISRFPKS